MFKFEYAHNGGSGESVRPTILVARFNFSDEIAPNKQDEVRKRYSGISSTLDNNLRGVTSPINLVDFLRDQLGFKYSNRGFMEFNGFRESVKICPFYLCIGFKLRSETQGYIPLENMIDLEAINEFMLTGKVTKEIKHQDQFRDLYYLKKSA